MTRDQHRQAPVLMAHNFYQQPGGEDEVFRSECRLLESHGVEVIPHVVENSVIGRTAGPRVAARTIWNAAEFRRLRAVCRTRRPRVLHVHNTFPLLSPAVYYAARAERVPVVQTLHNFRLACPNALFYRQGRICRDCVGRRVPWPAVVHACYRHSKAASAATSAMLTVHRLLGTYARQVDVFIALTQFARSELAAAGLPAERMVVKPNFLDPDPGKGAHGGRFALFVGRLSAEKGIGTLVKAWSAIGHRMPLRVVGDGPEGRLRAQSTPGIEWLGWRPRREVLELMQEAAFLVLPSEWFEHFPMTLVEAYAAGLPVIASDLGSLRELVDEGRTGRLFPAGDVDGLVGVLEQVLSSPGDLARQGNEARREFEQRYTAAANYPALMAIYDQASANARLHG
jgi:glycosyltransferase involved in cell wall biosynthesis